MRFPGMLGRSAQGPRGGLGVPACKAGAYTAWHAASSLPSWEAWE